MIFRPLLATVIVAFVAGIADTQEVPNVVVERHWINGDRAVRITLFDNHMAVTSVREKDRQVFLRQLTLGDDEYEIYLRAMAEVVAEPRGMERIPVDSIKSGARIELNLPGMAPSSFDYSPLQVLDLPTARLVGILDDLQQRVTEASPSQEALRLWRPAVDDLVELFVGGFATVTEIREEGVLILEQSNTGIILVVPREEWPMIIMRVVTQ